MFHPIQRQGRLAYRHSKSVTTIRRHQHLVSSAYPIVVWLITLLSNHLRCKDIEKKSEKQLLAKLLRFFNIESLVPSILFLYRTHACYYICKTKKRRTTAPKVCHPTPWIYLEYISYSSLYSFLSLFFSCQGSLFSESHLNQCVHSTPVRLQY